MITSVSNARSEEQFNPDDHAQALMNILEDAAGEGARLHDAQRAVMNILEDAAAERAQLELTQGAVLNILEDSGEEKLHLQQMQKAVLNILEDLAAEMRERSRLEERFRALLETAPDAIVIVNDAGRIVLVNARTEALFGYSRSDLLGQLVELLMPERFRMRHFQVRAQFALDARVRPMGADLELYGRRKDGTEFPTEILLSPVKTDEGVLVSAAIRDVSRTKDIEHQIRTSLKEKEALLQEIHHRVKNNLQIVDSLLSLQSGYIDEPRTLTQFQESQGRIRSMALIHEKLYRSDDLSSVDLADYVKSLVDMLMHAYADRSSVTLEARLARVAVSIDTAVPVGLMLNELVTNALKYAFPNDRPGRLTVTLSREAGGRIALQIHDDGVGLEPDFQFEKSNTLGLRLVRMFGRQLRADVTLRSRPGDTAFDVRFTEAAVSPS